VFKYKGAIHPRFIEARVLPGRVIGLWFTKGDEKNENDLTNDKPRPSRAGGSQCITVVVMYFYSVTYFSECPLKEVGGKAKNKYRSHRVVAFVFGFPLSDVFILISYSLI
jgi:hypothetical protein